WHEFAALFGYDCDDVNLAWRGEYWGKMMRGGCLVYEATADERLYRILTDAVLELLGCQREDGSFRTYSDACMLRGWDVWSRKYVLTGLLHFYEICSKDSLRDRVLDAACRHTDALMKDVGPGRIEITETSAHWLGVNSASFLEPLTELYMITGEERYRDFAGYIVSSGGIRGGDLVALALDGGLYPYQYPETKAYETTSFFEGVLGWYRITGEEKYLRAVLNFVEAVAASDVTVIGCSGCTHELFDNSAARQTEYLEGIMQETCVSVTWMRLCAKLYLLTGESKYLDRIEISALNALYGAENRAGIRVFHEKSGKLLDALPYDSYSPLYLGRRMRKTGGLQFFGDGLHYGCCAAIASAGIALPALLAVTVNDKGIDLNGFVPGSFDVKLPSGASVSGSCASDYPAGDASYEINAGSEVAIRVRIPACAPDALLLVDGEAIPVRPGEYAEIQVGAGRHRILFRPGFAVHAEKIAGRTAFFYGPLTLAAEKAADDPLDFSPEVPAGAATAAETLPPEFGETVRVRLPGGMTLTDYASAGHAPGREKDVITVFFNEV
ncbi:MAG: glycoside hydrolase family 127 protein, partial [Clostridia bacterium]|nr:glycoside hydrolase family 127 protein [Clostridia bacterium]